MGPVWQRIYHRAKLTPCQNRAKSHLEQNDKYKKLKNDTTSQVTNKVRKLVKNLHQTGMIDGELKQYMLPVL